MASRQFLSALLTTAACLVTAGPGLNRMDRLRPQGEQYALSWDLVRRPSSGPAAGEEVKRSQAAITHHVLAEAREGGPEQMGAEQISQDKNLPLEGRSYNDDEYQDNFQQGYQTEIVGRSITPDNQLAREEPPSSLKSGDVLFQELISRIHRLTAKLPPPLAEVESGGEHISLDELLRDTSGELIGNLDYTAPLEQPFEDIDVIKEVDVDAVDFTGDAEVAAPKPAFPELLRSIFSGTTAAEVSTTTARGAISYDGLRFADNEIDVDIGGRAVAGRKKQASLRLELSETPTVELEGEAGESSEATVTVANPEEFDDDGQASVDKSLVVKTAFGKVLGSKQNTSSDIQVFEFLGIPYAKPPLGPLRFQHPQPPNTWKGIRETLEHKPSCWSVHHPRVWEQSSTGMSEDCLYLSVWTPRLESGKPASQDNAEKREDSEDTRTGVLVVLLGEGGERGNLATLGKVNGRELAARGDMVVVFVESRRGSLGFLATNKKMAPGNAGLLDQAMALTWVQNNIDLFNGDPYKVTILGHGRQASLAALHLLSPVSCPLFQNLILQSGTPEDVLKSREDAHGTARSLANLLACDSSNEEELLFCLMGLDAQVITSQEMASQNSTFNTDPFPPILDGVFIFDQPSVLVEEQSFKKANLLVGSNANELLTRLVNFLPETSLSMRNLYLTEHQMNQALARIFPRYSSEVHRLIKYQYGVYHPDMENLTTSGVAEDPQQSGESALELLEEKLSRQDELELLEAERFWALHAMVSDNKVVCGLNSLARALAEDGNQVYRYYFDNQDDNIFSESTELNLLIGGPADVAAPEEPATAENAARAAVSYRFVRLWSSFVKHGSPNGRQGAARAEGLQSWPRYSSPGWTHLNINADSLDTGDNMRGRVCVFWQDVLPGLAPPRRIKPVKAKRSHIKAPGGPELTCRHVRRKAKVYYPGYRPVYRL